MRALKERGLRTMSKRFAGSMIAIAAAAVAVAWLLAAARDPGQGEARNATSRAAAPTPRTADGRVDLSGIWGTDRSSFTTSTMPSSPARPSRSSRGH